MVTLASPTPPTGDAAHRHPEIAQSFGSDAGTYDRARPRYPAALVDACNLRFMGGRMSPEERTSLIEAVRTTPQTNPVERARTALYLTLVAAQSQIDR